MHPTAGVFVPWVTRRSEKGFQEWVKDKNATVPYFHLSNGDMRLPPGQTALNDPTAAPLKVWQAPSYDSTVASAGGGEKLPMLPASKGVIDPELTVGFVANELLDPVSCSAAALAHCLNDFCAPGFPHNYLVHHCMNTWRGRIGTT
jgi:hypothetical protein